MSGPCPSAERLAAALRGTQPGAADADLAAHVSECPACQARLEQLAGGSGWLETKARTRTASASGTSERLRQAMQALESHIGEVHAEIPEPPKLDFLQPSNHANVLGSFGPYDVIAHVASGGMGIVLKARDPALDRVVALKILPPALAANALARSRFIREARAAAAVVHEHVVPIHAVDECGGLPYLVMQFVEGRPLSERIRTTGPLQLEEILRIGAQAAAGLAAAHARGLVHRDVKPSNILLENSVERVKLTDFGLARAVDDAGLTRTGELAGTPEFMSPEQASNEAVDHRSDLFSLGSVLYAMCTGVSPFQASSVIAAVRKVCDARPPPVHELNSALPRWLSDIVARLMAKLPDERFQSAREVGELFEDYLARVQHGNLAPLSEQQENQRRWIIPITTAAALALVTFGSFIWQHLKRSALPPVSRPLAISEALFLVRDGVGKTVGSYSDVVEAIRAAPASGVIELHWNGPRHIAPATISAKPLAIRAGQTSRPTWVHTNASVAALVTDAPLTLEGIEFVLRASTEHSSRDAQRREGLSRGSDSDSVGRRVGWRYEPSGGALVCVTKGFLKTSHCLFRLEGPGDIQRLLTCVILEDTASCELISSALAATPGQGIVWRSKAKEANSFISPLYTSASLTLSNCALDGGPAIWMEPGETSRWDVQILRSTFLGPLALFLPLTASTGTVSIIAQNNLFAVGTVLRDARQVPSVDAATHWQESENLFAASFAYIDNPAYSPGPLPVRTLADWNNWWMQTNASGRAVDVEFVVGRARPGRRDVGDEFEFSLSMFTVTNLTVVEGPPLNRDQWARFGADTANVGPATVK